MFSKALVRVKVRIMVKGNLSVPGTLTLALKLTIHPIPGVSLKDDGPTGQTTGQRGSGPSAYRVSITGYYNILQGIKPETTQKAWILLSSNAHLTKYSTRIATITAKLKIKHKKYHEYTKAIYIFSTYVLPQ